MRPAYPSDINRDQFESIRELLEQARKKTKPRTVDLYNVFCGVLYVKHELNSLLIMSIGIPVVYPSLHGDRKIVWSSFYSYCSDNGLHTDTGG